MTAEFLWGDSTDHKNYHRIKWATLCLSKLEGGVGLRDLSETNQANLANLVYRMSQQSSPWAELVRGRYYECKGLTDNSIWGKRVSKAWRRAFQAWSKIKGDVRRKIGNGELDKFWTDQWGVDRMIDKIPTTHLHLVRDTIGSTVKDIMEVNGDYISHFLASLNIPFNRPSLHDEQQDVMVWRYGDQKDLNWHEIWQMIRKNGTKNNDNMLVWKGRRPPRATWTVYLGVSGRLPTDSYVQNQSQSLASRCSVCKQEIEDLKHVFYTCKGARLATHFWMHCNEYWWNSHWKGTEHDKVCNWLRSGIPWSNGVMYEDRWVDISISLWCKDNKRGVAGLIRDVSGGFRFGLACWFGNNTGWRETEVLLECIGYLVNIEDNLGRIYLWANDGDWKLATPLNNTQKLLGQTQKNGS
ncbi:hypothetical protein EJ110_NYTH28911 [Nymphaea thermarum]|nr:hypothetical protein EJ110_NYTH28911 [Nymphaea thermarum]